MDNAIHPSSSGEQPSEEKNLEKKEISGKKKGLLILAVGLTVIAVIGTIVFVLLNRKGGGGSGDDSGSSIATMIPIWAAVFIPIIASKNKDKNESSSHKKAILIGAVGLTVLLVLGTVFFVFFRG
ncbi:MAG: hypothetical protein HOJ15_00445 [Candidatus Jacksonbacteria bacterium]|jgi:flagellar basal body-associated protein FliL|nr:hypothetical protein [Candidatus Jacksonbacteria bacterium]MBT6034230.1 hypothetical protein [Candidatus Jacksonbacteria bacterium]MBT6300882.1 hypothetical protein [Candidatus Jacksonbacteria bacterium]MBT6756879.1 hypothetical protein [Candidatus Jacksonbacteria bacterium]MBT6955169.1 hypothetical protein [Candidatus Jacksonbacteria bacterium]